MLRNEQPWKHSVFLESRTQMPATLFDVSKVNYRSSGFAEASVHCPCTCTPSLFIYCIRGISITHYIIL